MVSPKKMRNDKLITKQFFIYHFYDFMFFTDLDTTFTRSRALGWLFDPALQFVTWAENKLYSQDFGVNSWNFFIIGISIVYVKIKLYTKFDAKMLIRSKVMID